MTILFKLTATHQPGDTIQTFQSLSWTERYRDAGDFQLVVENEVSILGKLPLGTLISHTDTKEVMIVENHEINRDKEKKLLVTISGRSLETFAENRPTIGSALRMADPATDIATPPETSAVEPACHVAMHLLQGRLQPGIASASDAIPNLLVREDVLSHEWTMAHVIKRGDVYARVIELLRICDAGIKVIRPSGAQTTLDLVVHDGSDLTIPVIFYAQYEDLDDAKYLWSIKDYKNYAQIATHTYARLYRDANLTSDLTGLDRRVMYVEADDILGIYDPPTAGDVVSARGQSELDGKPKISLMSATISVTAKPTFKINYDVGDLVTVYGEFGSSQTMRVTEHILTVDKTGRRGYPSLSIA